MNELTYFLGAGASYNSMPLVENFYGRFNYFIDFLSNSDFDRDKRMFIADCQEFEKSVFSHLSFDTFFKKLFHQKEKEKIRKYKALLLIYFLFEHLVKIPKYVDEDYDSRVKEKKSNNDPRYEALIAGLLKPIEINEFYTKVNFITWNYDLNLINSIKNFLFPGTHLSKLIVRHKVGVNYLDFQGKVFITQLNGLIEHPKLDDIQEVDREELIRFFDKVIHEYFTSNGDIYKFSAAINFSWESLSTDYIEQKFPSFVEKAKEAISKSSTIIIVGYSFPLYNRLIDTYLLNGKNLDGKRVFIQDPNANELKEVFRNEFSLNIDIDPHPQIPQTTVKAITACNSFFVPNSVFGN